MESPEPQFNAKEEKGLSSHRVFFESVDCACWPFFLFDAPRARERERECCPLKTLKALTCSLVPRCRFFQPLSSERPGTRKKC